jgi:carbon monoxide dehydrogenase subunit G
MRFSQEFVVNHSRDKVWEVFGDLETVAACFPGAEITQPLNEGRFAGRVSVTLGPMRLNFIGEGGLRRNEADWTGTIEGGGEDRVTRSRAKAVLSYGLSDNLEGSTLVEVEMDYQLFGPLAQIGRPALVEEVAKQLTIEFKEELDEVVGNKVLWKVAKNHARREISIVRLLFQLVCKRITSLLPDSDKAKED